MLFHSFVTPVLLNFVKSCQWETIYVAPHWKAQWAICGFFTLHLVV